MAARSVETTGPAETESLGAELARALGDGDVVLVRGELGSGKTTLVRGAARALGVQRSGHQPDVQHRPPLRGARRDRLAPGPLPARRPRARGPGAARRLPRPGTDRVRGVARGHARGARPGARARDAQPRRRRPPAHRRRRAGLRARDDRARLRHLYASHRRGAAPGGRQHDASSATTRPRARTRATPRDCWRWPPSCSHGPASAGARSTASPSAWDRARSRACASASPRRAASRSRSSAELVGVSSLQALAAAGARRAARPGGGARGDRRAPRRGVRGCLPGGETGCAASSSPPRALAPEAARERRSPRPSGPPARRPGPGWRSATARCAFALSSRRAASRSRRTPRRCTCSAPARSASWARAADAGRQSSEILPDYRRRPDAELALAGAGTR